MSRFRSPFASLPALAAALSLAACGGDDDGADSLAPTTDVGFDPAAPTVLLEGDAPIVVSLQVASPPAGDASLRLVVGGTAETTDVSISPIEFVLTPATQSVELTIASVDDDLFEIEEELTLDLLQLSGAPLGLPAAPLTVTLIDDEPLPSLSFALDGSETIESALEHTVLLELSGPAELPVFFEVEASGTATADADYELDLSNLFVAPGERTRVLTLAPVFDAAPEADVETLELALGQVVNAAVGDPALHVVSILNQDAERLAFTARLTDGSRPLLLGDSSAGPPANPTAEAGSSIDVESLYPSGDGARMALRGTVFDRDGLHVVPLAGGEILRVSPVESPLLQVEPDVAWSPDDAWIAFRVNVALGTGLYTVRPDGSDLTALAAPQNGLRVQRFAWSPDGQRIAWTRGIGPGLGQLSHRRLFAARPDGSETTQLTPYADGLGVEPDFAWLDGGAALAFRSALDLGTPFEVYRVAVGGPAPTPAVELLTPGAAGSALALLPDPAGERLAYIGRTLDGFIEELFLVNGPGAEPLELSDPSVTARVLEAAWAPDGSRIAYRSVEPTRLSSVLPDGSGRVDLTGSALGISEFAWSPDSASVAFLAQDELHLAPADGPGAPLLPTQDFEPGLQWSPDSRRIAVVSEGEVPQLVTFLAATAEFAVLDDLSALVEAAGPPRWSPLGLHLAYGLDVDGAERLVVARVVDPVEPTIVPVADLAPGGLSVFSWLD